MRLWKLATACTGGWGCRIDEAIPRRNLYRAWWKVTRKPFVKTSPPRTAHDYDLERIPAANLPSSPPSQSARASAINSRRSTAITPLLRNNYCRSYINARETKHLLPSRDAGLWRFTTIIPSDLRREVWKVGDPLYRSFIGFDRPATVSCSEE